MGMVRHDAYTLLLQGEGVLEFINGLSTNLVTGAFLHHGFTNRAAQIVDVCEVIPVGSNVALVGFRPHKDQLVNHLSERILGQPITINDISELNDVFSVARIARIRTAPPSMRAILARCTSFLFAKTGKQLGRWMIGTSTGLNTSSRSTAMRSRTTSIHLHAASAIWFIHRKAAMSVKRC